MVNIQLQIKGAEKLQALMDALGPSNLKRLNTVGAKALEVKIRSHVARISASRHASAAAVGGTPTGHYRKGMRGIAGTATAAGGQVTIPIAGISRAYHDIILSVPTRFGKNFYAIPKHAKSYGHTVDELRTRGWKIFRPGESRCLLGYRNKGEKPVLLYTLAEKIHQRKDPTLLPAKAECSIAVREAMTRSINERIRNAR